MKVTESRLDNGLTVMLTENHDAPKVFRMVAIKAGGKNDPSDATGIAHYLEYVLFNGSQDMSTLIANRRNHIIEFFKEDSNDILLEWVGYYGAVKHFSNGKPLGFKSNYYEKRLIINGIRIN